MPFTPADAFDEGPGDSPARGSAGEAEQAEPVLRASA